MKDLITDANFPRTLDQRVYHLGIRAGEVANRIVSTTLGASKYATQSLNLKKKSQITVGAPSRAERISKYLDVSPKPFRLSTERGFVTVTGRYKGVPISIISIGMGNPNVDFFIREVRECLSGDMVVVRSSVISPF
ncbi:hypothetical protein PHLCEN_2v1459 [Hermanssonia centrifuga]|uniref:Nucleoside phosphorylase domain-containing protein n=1 Tax=Hermanssonia centrifuga TaxID=98765 RepID=A0A2R6RZX6_9APHY|nr:hypothetical protein PHLCEN_2v1459 [Hermanssonia centrifuga]